MNEDLFQFIWKNALFDTGRLETTEGQKVTILQRGFQNVDAGPDFSNAKIMLDQTVWAGNIEIHLRSSDWKRHAHEQDPNYKRIILHVVFEDDSEETLGNFPTLELKPHVNLTLLVRYQRLMEQQQPIPCGEAGKYVPQIIWQQWLERLCAERWEQRQDDWQQLLAKSHFDWRQLFYARLLANFGLKVNKDAFLDLAALLPLNILEKHKDQLQQVEALLFGQAGLLPTTEVDDYVQALRREYDFLKKKYHLQALEGRVWKFMRMRPVNFPTVRLAQCAAIIHGNDQLFQKIIYVQQHKEVQDLLAVEPSPYWATHYTFGKVARKIRKPLGKDMIDNIIINTIAPLKFYFAQHTHNSTAKDQAIRLMLDTQPEKNRILATWASMGINAKDALQSQGLIQLFNNFCQQKKCLDCAIGLKILKDEPHPNLPG